MHPRSGAQSVDVHRGCLQTCASCVQALHIIVVRLVFFYVTTSIRHYVGLAVTSCDLLHVLPRPITTCRHGIMALLCPTPSADYQQPPAYSCMHQRLMRQVT